MTDSRAARSKYWLVKSEPSVYSMSDLVRDGRTAWEGVRNYQARNNLQEMKVGDLVLFYHSSAEPPGVAGIARVSREAYPDAAAWDRKSDYYDEKSTPEKPRWFVVEIEPVEAFPAVLPLEALKADPRLEGMPVLARGQRLSVQPVTKPHFDRVVTTARKRR